MRFGGVLLVLSIGLAIGTVPPTVTADESCSGFDCLEACTTFPQYSRGTLLVCQFECSAGRPVFIEYTTGLVGFGDDPVAAEVRTAYCGTFYCPGWKPSLAAPGLAWYREADCFRPFFEISCGEVSFTGDWAPTRDVLYAPLVAWGAAAQGTKETVGVVTDVAGLYNPLNGFGAGNPNSPYDSVSATRCTGVDVPLRSGRGFCVAWFEEEMLMDDWTLPPTTCGSANINLSRLIEDCT